ncbi:MAG: extracellular solute-binding protein [Bacillota bacterium]
MKKVITLFLAVLMIAATVFGCAAPDPEPAISSQAPVEQSAAPTAGEGRKQISFWFWGAATPHQEHIKKVLADWYNNSQNEYELVIEFRNTVDKDIPVALAANAGPDIVYASGPSYTSVYAQEGKVIDLNKYSEQYGWKDRLLSVMYDACTIDGKLYSLPNAILIGGIFYNKELFAEKGWTPPKTMDEFTAICDAAMADGLYALSAGNKGWKPCNDHFSSMIVNHTISPSNFYQCLKGEISFDNPEMIKAVEKSAEWYQKGYLSGNDYTNLDSQEVMQVLADKRAAMVIAPTLYIQFASQSFVGDLEDDIGFVPMPSYFTDQMIYDVSMACNFSISATTPYADECAKILDHMMTAEFLAEMTAGWPGYWTVPVKDLSSIDTSKFTGLSKMTIEAIQAAAPEIDKGNFGFHPSTFFPPATSVAWQDIDMVWQGAVSAEEFCKTVASKMKDEINLVCPLAKPAL